MKKIILILFASFAAFTFYYSYLLFSQISKNQYNKYSDLQKNFLSAQQITSNFLKSLETQALLLENASDPATLKGGVSGYLISVAAFDSNKKFLHGWAMDPDQHIPVYQMTTSLFPQTTLVNGWVAIHLDSHYYCRGYYVIQKEDQSYLVMTFSLTPAIDAMGLICYGFRSSPYIEHIDKNGQITPFIFSQPNILSRLFNDQIHLEAPVLSDWLLVFSGVWQDVYPYSIPDIHLIFYNLVLWGILSTFCIAILLKIHPSKPKTLWITSSVFNAFCLLLTVFFFIDLPSTYNLITERTISFRKTEALPKNLAILVPTAIYLESLEFPNDSSFLISGFISQIYPKNENLKYGFIFPNESILYETTIDEVSRWETESSVAILWHFCVGLTSSFSPVFFPFDTRSVRINLWPNEIHQDIVFFPNFLNYRELHISNLISIDPNVNPIEWEILDSAYLLHPKESYAFFGFSHLPISFEFSIFLQRDFLGAFLSNILVLTLCMFVAFFVLFIPTDSLLDSLFATISIFVGLLFVAVTNHAVLRNNLEATSFAYLEYLFISFYVLILAITIDFIFRVGKKASKYNTNLLRRVLYWPVILGSFCALLSYSIIY